MEDSANRWYSCDALYGMMIGRALLHRIRVSPQCTAKGRAGWTLRIDTLRIRGGAFPITSIKITAKPFVDSLPLGCLGHGFFTTTAGCQMQLVCSKKLKDAKRA